MPSATLWRFKESFHRGWAAFTTSMHTALEFCDSKLFTPFGTISSNLETIRSSFHEHFQPRDRFIFGLSWRWCFCHTCLRSPFYLLDTVCFHWSTPPHRSRRYCCDMCPALGNYFEVVPGSGIFFQNILHFLLHSFDVNIN